MRLFTLAVMTATLLSLVNGIHAQDSEDIAPNWETLVSQRAEIFTKLRELSLEARQKPDERPRIAEEFSALVEKMESEVFPGLKKLVGAKLADSPKDETVQEIAREQMEYEFRKNNYPEALRLANAIIKANPQDDDAINMAGVSHFAEHNFDESFRILSLAKKNNQLIGELGGQYLATSEKYIEYWKKEQAIREKEAAAAGNDQLPRVKFETPKGEIVLELFENEAPNTVANFISLVEKGFYDGLTFHRVLDGFMAQGGCPYSKTDPDLAGTGGPGYTIKCEAYRPDARRHFSGSLSMAHAGRDTGGSQFFITHLPTPHLDREIAPSSVHTVFGRVVEGLDVVRALSQDDVIEKASVLRKRNHEYVPETQPE